MNKMPMNMNKWVGMNVKFGFFKRSGVVTKIDGFKSLATGSKTNVTIKATNGSMHKVAYDKVSQD